jgi:predicted AAA+ superfamily ATPase
MFAMQLKKLGVPGHRIQMYNFEKPWHSKEADWRNIYRHIIEHVQSESMNYIFLDESQQIAEFERLIDALFV